MIVEIDGNNIRSEADFHKEIAQALNFDPYYGNNLNALWDVLSSGMGRPVTLVWKNVGVSQKSMPTDFDNITNLLREVEEEDAAFRAGDRFTFIAD